MLVSASAFSIHNLSLNNVLQISSMNSINISDNSMALPKGCWTGNLGLGVRELVCHVFNLSLSNELLRKFSEQPSVNSNIFV
jgi:hypothetical protein